MADASETPTIDPSPESSADPAPESSANPLDREANSSADDLKAQAAPDAAQGSGWFQQLPEEMRADKQLENFKDKPVSELAKGYVETKKLARSRVGLPTEGDDASFQRFVAAVRPESADAYKIELPEGADAAFGDAMRPVFHDIGLLPQQASRLVEANNKFAQDQAKARAKRETDAISGLKAEIGEAQFEQKKAAAAKLFDQIGVPGEFDDVIAKMLGSVTGDQGGATFMRLAFELAERSGELDRLEAGDVDIAIGSMTPQQAADAAAQMSKEYKGKLKKGNAEFDPAARKRYDALVVRASARNG